MYRYRKIEKKKPPTHDQFEIIVDFMERNGDLCRLSQGAEGRMERIQKWQYLAEMLNTKENSKHARSVEKWRKAWSDFKNSTRKKYERNYGREGEGGELSNIEKRVLKLLGGRRQKKRVSSQLDSSRNGLNLKEPHETVSSSPPPYFCKVEVNPETRRSSVSSYASTSSFPSPTTKKHKDSIPDVTNEDKMQEVTDKFLEFERERENITHKREMARIEQNEKFLNMFERAVMVLENLAPSIKRYLDKDIQNEDG